MGTAKPHESEKPTDRARDWRLTEDGGYKSRWCWPPADEEKRKEDGLFFSLSTLSLRSALISKSIVILLLFKWTGKAFLLWTSYW